MDKKKKIIILTILTGLLIVTSSALAARVSWPDNPAGHPFPEEGMPELIQYFYEWGIAIGGLLVFIALVIAGFQYLTSMGNPALMKEAKDRITSAFLGLVLLLGSWLILNTINPAFTHFPELELDLAKIAESSKERLEFGKGPACEFAYVYTEKDWDGDEGIMLPNETYDEYHERPSGRGTYWYIDPNRILHKIPIHGDPVSVRQMRHIECYGYNYEIPEDETKEQKEAREEKEVKDELLPIIRQAIAVCQNDRLAEMLPDDIKNGAQPCCSPEEIRTLVEENLKEQYGYWEANPPYYKHDPPCPAYQLKGEPFDCKYNFTNWSGASIPKYLISSGNCSVQISKGNKFTGGCGDRISEIYALDSDITRYIDADIECVKLVPHSAKRSKEE